MKRRPILSIAAVSALALGLLSGCETWSSITSYVGSSSSALCPDAKILASASTLPAFDAAEGTDPSSVMYTVGMTNISSRCSYDKRSRVSDSSLRITFRATRAPGGNDARYRVPYFVAASTGSDVVNKKMYWLDIEFPRGTDTANAEAYVDSFVIEPAQGKQGYDYHLIVGFQLTKAQLDYNTKMGRFAP